MKWTMKPDAYKWGALTLERATLLAGAVGLSTVVLRVGEGSRLFWSARSVIFPSLFFLAF